MAARLTAWAKAQPSRTNVTGAKCHPNYEPTTYRNTVRGMRNFWPARNSNSSHDETRVNGEDTDALAMRSSISQKLRTGFTRKTKACVGRTTLALKILVEGLPNAFLFKFFSNCCRIFRQLQNLSEISPSVLPRI